MRRFWIGFLLINSLFWWPVETQAQGVFDLQAALVAAQPGATVVVPAGVYPGALVIDKPVILEGQGNPVIAGTGHGDVITITAPDVTIRGFVIRHSGDSLDRENAGITGLAARATLENNRLEDTLFGIYLKNAPNSVVRNNVILSKALEMGRRGDGLRLWYCANSLVEGNHIIGSRDVIIWFAPHTVTRHNLIETSRYGLHFMSTDDQVVENNTLRNNSVGIYVMYGQGFTIRNNLIYHNRGPSGYGMGLKDVDNFAATGNRIVSNRVGVYIDNAPRASAVTVLFDHNLFAYNEIGITLLPLVKHTVYTSNIFQENGEQIALTGGGQLTENLWSQDGRGNYWSDYAGFDADANQVGDLPYRAQSLFEDLLQNYPELRLFQMSPAAQAIDLAAKAFPVFQPRTKITDDHPLMQPPALPSGPDLPTPSTTANLVTAVGLLVVAAMVLFFGLTTYPTLTLPRVGRERDRHP